MEQQSFESDYNSPDIAALWRERLHTDEEGVLCHIDELTVLCTSALANCGEDSHYAEAVRGYMEAVCSLERHTPFTPVSIRASLARSLYIRAFPNEPLEHTPTESSHILRLAPVNRFAHKLMEFLNKAPE